MTDATYAAIVEALMTPGCSPSELAHAFAMHSGELLTVPDRKASATATIRALRRVYDYASTVEAKYAAHKRVLRDLIDALSAEGES